MKFFTATVVAALASIAQAVRFDFMESFAPKAGQPTMLKWSENVGPVTINLKSGPSHDLKTVSTIIAGAAGNAYTWVPAANLPSDTYALEIVDSTGVNYSPQFRFEGSAPVPTSSVVPTTASAPASTVSSPVSTSVAVPTTLTTMSMPTSLVLTTTSTHNNDATSTSSRFVTSSISNSTSSTAFGTITSSRTSTSTSATTATGSPVGTPIFVGGSGRLMASLSTVFVAVGAFALLI